MSTFIENVPNVGTLYYEHLFYQLQEPVLFTAFNARGERFLITCCKIDENWLMVKPETADLIAMMKNQLTLKEVFENSPGKAFITWDGNTLRVFHSVPAEAYPKAGAYLDMARHPYTQPFIDQLEKEVART